MSINLTLFYITEQFDYLNLQYFFPCIFNVKMNKNDRIKI